MSLAPCRAEGRPSANVPLGISSTNRHKVIFLKLYPVLSLERPQATGAIYVYISTKSKVQAHATVQRSTATCGWWPPHWTAQKRTFPSHRGERYTPGPPHLVPAVSPPHLSPYRSTLASLWPSWPSTSPAGNHPFSCSKASAEKLSYFHIYV